MTARSQFIVLVVAIATVAAAPLAAGAVSPQTGDGSSTSSLEVVSISAPNSTAPNSTAVVTAVVTNTGRADAIDRVFPVEFRLGGDLIDRQWVEVAPGELATVQFAVNTTGLAPGEYLHGVYTETDGANARLTISESFVVDALAAPPNATAGENATIVATVSNPNDVEATQQVTYRFAGQALTSDRVTLDANNSTEYTIDLDVSGVGAGTYVHGVFTRDAGELATIDVLAEPPTETASVVFSDQESDGTAVTVDAANLPEGGFVAIHNASLLDGNVVGSVVGVSGFLDAGQSDNVTVDLFDVPGATFDRTQLTENGTLIAMPHMDTNGNATYDFVTSNAAGDGPYTVDGEPVVDGANVTVVTPTPAPTATPTPPASPTPTPTAPTATATPAPTTTPAPTDTATPAGTATPTGPTETVTSPGTPAQTATPVPTMTGTPTGSPPLTATGTPANGTAA